MRDFVGTVAAVATAACVVGCGHGDVSRADPAPTVPNFNDFTPVNAADYQTYRTYGSQGFQFTTSSGIRCRIYDGPHSRQYSAEVTCWGALAGVAPNVNLAKVAIEPYYKDSLTPITSSPVSPGTTVNSFVKHDNDLSRLETYPDGPTERKTVDATSYHLLAAGQKIVASGSRGGNDINNAVCAAAQDDLLVCEIQNMETDHGATHGFLLSPQGSRVY